MLFIGQKHIMGQLAFLLPHLYKDVDASAHFLLQAASGQGKTRMAHEMCRYLAGKHYQFHLGDIDNFDPATRVHFVDEAHLVKDFELIYPLLDSSDYIFIFATNEYTTLPEPVVNRCYALTFVEYTVEEMYAIINTISVIRYKESFLDYIIKSGGKNPRIILSLVKRLNIYFLNEKTPNKLSKFKGLLKKLFGIVDGIDPIAASYLEILETIGGIAGISTISGMLKIDETTLKTRVEPLLLANNLIQITRQGRKLCL